IYSCNEKRNISRNPCDIDLTRQVLLEILRFSLQLYIAIILLHQSSLPGSIDTVRQGPTGSP
ncbi:MAG: hypothetical protein OER87_20770, partial [Gammaproteobacteria bacterium]|nr:hypothetical protein [Gammaproteobacteria bacterium]